MPRKHIVMVGCTAPSHIYPSLGVISELVRRGHRVSYVVGAPLASLVAPTGAEVVEHPTIFPLGERRCGRTSLPKPCASSSTRPSPSTRC